MDVSNDIPGTVCRLSISRFIKVCMIVTNSTPTTLVCPCSCYTCTLMLASCTWSLTSAIAQIRWWRLSWRRPQYPPSFSTDDRTTQTRRTAGRWRGRGTPFHTRRCPWFRTPHPTIWRGTHGAVRAWHSQTSDPRKGCGWIHLIWTVRLM